MDETRALAALYETRRRIEALRQAEEPADSPRLLELQQRHDDLLAALNEHAIVTIAWQDDWSPAFPHYVKPKPAATAHTVDALRPRVLAASAGVMLLLFFLFVIAPELIGDRPYNVF